MTGFAKPKPYEITNSNRMGFAKLKPPETIKFETKNNRQDSTDSKAHQVQTMFHGSFSSTAHICFRLLILRLDLLSIDSD
jgi:hypothetical protein